MQFMEHVDEIKELDALVSLMDEPNENMFNEIREKVLSYGRQAIPALEEAWVNTLGDDDSKRIEGVIDEIKQSELFSGFKSWLAEGASNLMQGALILTKYLQPDFDENHYNVLFEKLYRETWLEINDSLTALEKIKVINHIFYSVYKFNGDHLSIINTDTYFLNKVIEHKKGNPISIGVLYIAVAQKLNIPIFGVNLPGHFILAYMDDFVEMRLPEEYSEAEVLFYINTVNNGAIFTSNEVGHYISKMKIDTKPEYYLPCTNKQVIKRMISDLVISLESEGQHSKANSLINLLNEF